MDPQLQKQIIDALGISALPEEKREEVLMRVGSIIFQEVMARVFDVLSDTEKGELEKLFDDNASFEDVFGYIRSHVSTFDAIVTEEASRFRDETLKVMGK